MVPNIGWAQVASCLPSARGWLSKACTASLMWLGRSVLPPSRGSLGEAPGEGGEPRWVQAPCQAPWSPERPASWVRLPGLRPQALPGFICSRTNRDLIHYKSSVCSTMKAKFYSVAQEAGFCLQDKMEILMK